MNLNQILMNFVLLGAIFKTKFINNSSTSTINGLTVEQRQSLTDALKPKEDE